MAVNWRVKSWKWLETECVLSRLTARGRRRTIWIGKCRHQCHFDDFSAFEQQHDGDFGMDLLKNGVSWIFTQFYLMKGKFNVDMHLLSVFTLRTSILYYCNSSLMDETTSWVENWNFSVILRKYWILALIQVIPYSELVFQLSDMFCLINTTQFMPMIFL